MTSEPASTHSPAQAALRAVQVLEDTLDGSPVPPDVAACQQITGQLEPVLAALAELLSAYARVLGRQPLPGTRALIRAFTRAAADHRDACRHLRAARDVIQADAASLGAGGSAPGPGLRPAQHAAITAAQDAACQLRSLLGELDAQAAGPCRAGVPAVVAEAGQCLTGAAAAADRILLLTARHAETAYQAAGIGLAAPAAMRSLHDAAMAMRIGFCAIDRARGPLDAAAAPQDPPSGPASRRAAAAASLASPGPRQPARGRGPRQDPRPARAATAPRAPTCGRGSGGGTAGSPP
jgi:hypothetical protein